MNTVSARLPSRIDDVSVRRPDEPSSSNLQGSANAGSVSTASVDAPRPEALTTQSPSVAPAAPWAGDPGVGTSPNAAAAAASQRTTAVKESTVGRRSLSGRKQRFEARKVHRIIRHIDPWSVLKLSVVFFLCVWVMFMVAIVIVWSIAESSGTVGKIEDLLAELDITNSGFDGTFIFRQYGLFGLVMATGCTIATTIGAIVFNLVSDLIGGIWITVIEEETARPTAD